jgi:hypothetical protein
LILDIWGFKFWWRRILVYWGKKWYMLYMPMCNHLHKNLSSLIISYSLLHNILINQWDTSHFDVNLIHNITIPYKMLEDFSWKMIKWCPWFQEYERCVVHLVIITSHYLSQLPTLIERQLKCWPWHIETSKITSSKINQCNVFNII